MADLKINGITPLDIKLGTSQVSKVYQGSILVWSLVFWQPYTIDISGSLTKEQECINPIFSPTVLYLSRLIGAAQVGDFFSFTPNGDSPINGSDVWFRDITTSGRSLQISSIGQIIDIFICP